jgi:AcrR family transcriptional regulator
MTAKRARAKANYHHGDLRRALMDVSIDILNQQEVETLNLRKLAALMGVSPGAPYHHFADRAELVRVIAEEGFALLERAMHKAIAESGSDGSARLEALGQAYVQFAVHHPGYFRVMFRRATHDQVTTAMQGAGRRTFQLLCDAITACQRDGSAPAGDPQPLILHAWAAVHGLSTLLVDGDLKGISIPARQLAPVMTNLMRRMLTALAESPAAGSSAGDSIPLCR